MRILVSGGGTAGHISPVLATLDALRRRVKEVEVLYVGERGGIESKIASSAGWKFQGISAGKLRRYHGSRWWQRFDLQTWALNLRDLGRLARGFFQSLGILRAFKPDVVFIKGGYVGLPVGWAARVLRVPYVIHESDVVPGLTNRLLAAGATAIAVGFPVDKYSAWPAAKLHFTGSPIRQQLLQPHRLEGLAHFQFSEALPVVLVMGGSQGARAINNVVLAALPRLAQHYQIIHLTGEGEIDRVRFEVQRLRLSHPERHRAFAFLTGDLGLALAAADVAVSRAGANAVAELAALGKPTILIPNSRLAGDHQTANARVLARAEAVRVLPESKLDAKSLVKEIEYVCGSPDLQKKLAKKIQSFAQTEADQALADLILQAKNG